MFPRFKKMLERVIPQKGSRLKRMREIVPRNMFWINPAPSAQSTLSYSQRKQSNGRTCEDLKPSDFADIIKKNVSRPPYLAVLPQSSRIAIEFVRDFVPGDVGSPLLYLDPQHDVRTSALHPELIRLDGQEIIDGGGRLLAPGGENRRDRNTQIRPNCCRPGPRIECPRTS